MGVSPLRLVFWLALCSIGIGAIAYFATEPRRHDGDGDADEGRITVDFLIGVPLETIDAVEIMRQQGLFVFERDEERRWYLHGYAESAGGDSEHAHLHPSDPAESKRIAEALELMTRARVERDVAPAAPAGLEAFGFQRPAMTVVLYREGDSRAAAEFQVGDLAPDSFSRYVLVDRNRIVTVPDYHIENLRSLVADIAK